jgi:F-type H+-transporting ATPase subunit gamma
MSGTTEGLRRKISGAEDLQSVVRSMKALAASRIGQYESAVLSLQDYYRTVKLGLSACIREAGPVPIVEIKMRRQSKGFGAVVFGSDQGLVGGFNEVIVNSFADTARTLSGGAKRMWAIGERAHELLKETASCPVGLLLVPTSVDSMSSLVGQILIEIETSRENGELWEIYVFHNKPKFGALYEPVCKRLLPLDTAWQEKLADMPWPTHVLPEVIEDVTSVLPALVRGYLFVVLFQACADSLASENASRLAAMQRAEKNIEDILEDLNRTLHRIRQESIDEELFDVISGFEALTKHSAT